MCTRSKVPVFGPVVLMGAMAAACATSSPPRELVEARQEFQKASAGPASQVNPAGLLQAKKALDRANQEFEEHPTAPSTADFAYVALRRAQLAEVQAETLLASQQKLEADRQTRELQAQRRARTQRLADQERQNARQQIGGSGPPQAPSAASEPSTPPQAAPPNGSKGEQNQATRADRETEQLRVKLANLGTVRQERRGIVLSFADSDLFASGRSTLRPSARSKLNQVAAALSDGGEKILIEGHTDASGSDRVNVGLSERRAITVRNYLRDRGISPERMTAIGFGASRPRASNATPQGRAKNRRVDIVVEGTGPVSTG